MEAVNKLEKLIQLVEDNLSSFSKEEWDKKPNPDKWSKKEILGHLIDSEINNRARVIKSVSTSQSLIIESYMQNEWVKRNAYQEQPFDIIFNKWKIHQQSFVNLLGNVSESELKNHCLLSDGRTESLGWLINDYAAHQMHHLKQIFGDTLF